MTERIVPLKEKALGFEILTLEGGKTYFYLKFAVDVAVEGFKKDVMASSFNAIEKECLIEWIDARFGK